MPAMLARMWMPWSGKADWAAARILDGASSSVRLTWMKEKLVAVDWGMDLGAGERSTPRTDAPASRNVLVVDRPIPFEAPVTIAT
jgi:hypothetical protein